MRRWPWVSPRVYSRSKVLVNRAAGRMLQFRTVFPLAPCPRRALSAAGGAPPGTALRRPSERSPPGLSGQRESALLLFSLVRFCVFCYLLL